MNIGDVLVSLRKTKGIEQQELAKVLDKSVTYISLIENNRRKPSVSLLAEIANYYGIPVTAIIFKAMSNQGLKSERSASYFKAAEPIVDQLIQYLITDDETPKEKVSLANRNSKAKKHFA